MVKEVLRQLDYSICAEVALVLFVLVFFAISLWTVFRPASEMNQQASIPLTDDPVEPRGEQNNE